MKAQLRNIKAGQYVVTGGQVLRRGETRWACYRLTGGNSARLHGSKTYDVFDDLREAESLAAAQAAESAAKYAKALAEQEQRIASRRQLFEAAGGWAAAERWVSENPTATGNCIPGSGGYKNRIYRAFCDHLEASVKAFDQARAALAEGGGR